MCSHPFLMFLLQIYMRTVKISERIERAVQQRLFLVDVSAPTTCPDNGGLLVKLRVLGSTGKYRMLM